MSIDLSPNEDADANVVVTELNDWVKQSEMVQEKVDELMAGNKLDAIFCVAGGWAGGNAKSKSEFFFVVKELLWKIRHFCLRYRVCSGTFILHCEQPPNVHLWCTFNSFGFSCLPPLIIILHFLRPRRGQRLSHAHFDLETPFS